MRACVRRYALVLATVLCAGTALGCGAAEPAAVQAPRDAKPGRQLPWPEAAAPAAGWSFARDEQEIALETAAPWGRHSVTVWAVVVDGKLYVATDSSKSRKRWVRELDRDPVARVGIRERCYRVRVRAVREPAEWQAVLAAYQVKYGKQIGRYDFPTREDTSRGRVFELAARP